MGEINEGKIKVKDCIQHMGESTGGKHINKQHRMLAQYSHPE